MQLLLRISNIFFLALPLVFLLFMFNLPCVKTITGGEQKLANKVKAYITTFLVDDQLHTVLNNISGGIYEMKNASQIANDVLSNVMDTLTSTQLMSAMPVINALNKDFGGISAAMEAMDPIFDVLSNNFTPMLEQMQAKDIEWTNQGKGQTACTAQQYRMINSFLTKNRVQTFMTRMKAATPPKNWTMIYNDVKDIIMFSKYVTA